MESNKEPSILEYTSLKQDYEALLNKHDSMILKFKELQLNYDELEEKYNELDENYKENTIIQSMNEMKKKYDSLIINTVPKYRYNLLSNKCEEMSKVFSSVEVIVNHIAKGIKRLDNHGTIDTNAVYKIQLELLILKEIIQDVIEPSH